jgi:hypothetical protein
MKNNGLNGFDWANFGLTIAMGVMTLGSLFLAHKSNQQHLADYQNELMKINDTYKIKTPPTSNG